MVDLSKHTTDELFNDLKAPDPDTREEAVKEFGRRLCSEQDQPPGKHLLRDDVEFAYRLAEQLVEEEEDPSEKEKAKVRERLLEGIRASKCCSFTIKIIDVEPHLDGWSQSDVQMKFGTSAAKTSTTPGYDLETGKKTKLGSVGFQFYNSAQHKFRKRCGEAVRMDIYVEVVGIAKATLQISFQCEPHAAFPWGQALLTLPVPQSFSLITAPKIRTQTFDFTYQVDCSCAKP